MSHEQITPADGWPFWRDPHSPPLTWLASRVARVTDYDPATVPGDILALSRVEMTWLPNGQLTRCGVYVDGQRVGVHRFYHENGQLWYVGAFEAGKKVGVHRHWHDNGQPEFEGAYEAGRAVGVHKEWWSNGQLWAEGAFAADCEVGVHREWSADGTLVSEMDFE